MYAMKIFFPQLIREPFECHLIPGQSGIWMKFATICRHATRICLEIPPCAPAHHVIFIKVVILYETWSDFFDDITHKLGNGFFDHFFT